MVESRLTLCSNNATQQSPTGVCRMLLICDGCANRSSCQETYVVTEIKIRTCLLLERNTFEGIFYLVARQIQEGLHLLRRSGGHTGTATVDFRTLNGLSASILSLIVRSRNVLGLKREGAPP